MLKGRVIYHNNVNRLSTVFHKFEVTTNKIPIFRANKCSLFSHHLRSSATLSIFFHVLTTQKVVFHHIQYSQAQRYSFLTYYMKMIIKWDHNYICFEKTYHLHYLIAVNTRNISEPYPVITGNITHWMNSPVSNSPRPLI